MDINGLQHIAAPRERVWDALNDPDVLQRCVPGCESVEKLPDGAFRIVVAMAIGPLRARFNGLLTMADAQPPQSCAIVFEGQGGPVGFGKGTTTVVLDETAAGTELRYDAAVQIGGKLAQVGSRLIDGVAKKLSDAFFNALREELDAAHAETPGGQLPLPPPA